MRNRMGRGKSAIAIFTFLLIMVMSVTGCGLTSDKAEQSKNSATPDLTEGVSYPLKPHAGAIIDFKDKMYNDAGKVADVPKDLGTTYDVYYNKDWSGAILYSHRGPCYYVDRDLNFKFLCSENTCAAISFNGEAVVYGQGDSVGVIELYWYDVEKDESVKIMSSDSSIASAALSPNGKKVAFVQYGGDNSQVFVAERDSRPEPVAKGHYDVLSVSDAGDVICTEYFGKVYSFSKGKKKTIADDWHMDQYCLNNKCTEIMYTGRGERGDENVYYYAFGMDGPELVYEGGVGTLMPGGTYVRQSNSDSSLFQNIYDAETLLGTVFFGAEFTPYMFHGAGRETEQFPARSTVRTINLGEEYTVMVAQNSAENKSVTIKKYKNGTCLDEKVLDGITRRDATCDARGRCFYILDASGVLYRYEDDELKEIDSGAKTSGAVGIKFCDLDRLLYYPKGNDLYVIGDETEPTLVAKVCDYLTDGFGDEHIIFYQRKYGSSYALIFGSQIEPY